MNHYPMSGVVGWEITAAGLRDFLTGAAGKDVSLSISSPGGYVGEALEIYNLLRNYPGKVTAILSGYVMSAASYIAMAADQIVAEDNAIMMIHNAQGLAVGDQHEMAKNAEILAGMSMMIAQAYAHRTGLELPDVVQMMDDETWLFGEEIVDAMFADQMVAGEDAEPEPESARKAKARLAFANMRQKMAADADTFTNDLQRVVNYASRYLPNGQPANRHQAQNLEEPHMDLAKLKAEHPELVAAITDEAVAALDLEAQLTAAREEGKKEGAKAERDRIADCRAMALAGHETLVETMAFDGQSTGADVAKAIVNAEKDLRAKAAGDFAKGNQVVATVEPEQGKNQMKRAEWQQLDAKAQAEFSKSGGVVVD